MNFTVQDSSDNISRSTQAASRWKTTAGAPITHISRAQIPGEGNFRGLHGSMKVRSAAQRGLQHCIDRLLSNT